MITPSNKEFSIEDSLSHLKNMFDTHKKDHESLQGALRGFIEHLKKAQQQISKLSTKRRLNP